MMRYFFVIFLNSWLLLLPPAAHAAAVCTEPGTSAAGTPASSDASTIKCDMKYRDTVVNCLKQTTDPSCPPDTKPMAMKDTKLKSLIKDFTPELFSYLRDPKDITKAYAGEFYRGTEGDATNSYMMAGGGSSGDKRLAPCIPQITFPTALSATTSPDEQAKMVRMQLDNCTNQYILRNAMYSIQKEDANLVSLVDPNDPAKKISLATHCQPLKTAQVPKNEYDAGVYLEAAWKKMLFDPAYRLNDKAKDEPHLPDKITLKNPIEPPSPFPEVKLSELSGVKYEEINDPTHPFTPRWDYEFNERDHYSPKTKDYSGDDKNSVFCAGDKTNQKIKVDILSFREATLGFDKKITDRIDFNKNCMANSGQQAASCCKVNRHGSPFVVDWTCDFQPCATCYAMTKESPVCSTDHLNPKDRQSVKRIFLPVHPILRVPGMLTANLTNIANMPGNLLVGQVQAMVNSQLAILNKFSPNALLAQALPKLTQQLDFMKSLGDLKIPNMDALKVSAMLDMQGKLLSKLPGNLNLNANQLSSLLNGHADILTALSNSGLPGTQALSTLTSVSSLLQNTSTALAGDTQSQLTGLMNFAKAIPGGSNAASTASQLMGLGNTLSKVNGSMTVDDAVKAGLIPANTPGLSLISGNSPVAQAQAQATALASGLSQFGNGTVGEFTGALGQGMGSISKLQSQLPAGTSSAQLGGMLSDLQAGAKTVAGGANSLGQAANAAGNTAGQVAGALGQVNSGITQGANNVLGQIGSAISTQAGNLPNFTGGMNMSEVSNMLGSAGNMLSGGLNGANNLIGGANGALNGIAGNINTALTGANGVTGGINDAINGANGAVTSVTSQINNALSGATGGINSALGGATGGINTAINGINGAIGGVTGQLTGAISNVTAGLTTQLTSLANMANLPISQITGMLNGQMAILNNFAAGLNIQALKDLANIIPYGNSLPYLLVKFTPYPRKAKCVADELGKPANTKKMAALCTELRAPVTMINKLKMRYHNPNAPDDMALPEGVPEGLAFHDYFDNRMPYPRLWDTGTSIQRAPSDALHQAADDDSGQWTAVVGVGREAQPKSTGGGSSPAASGGGLLSKLTSGSNLLSGLTGTPKPAASAAPAKAQDERCLYGGWGGDVTFAGATIKVPDPVTSWTELKLYQTNTLRREGLVCIGRYEKAFKYGSAENNALLAAGSSWQSVIINVCERNKPSSACKSMSMKEYLDAGQPQSTNTKVVIKQLKQTNQPRDWLGYMSAKNSSTQFPNFGGGTMKLYTGLTSAKVGDIVMMPDGAAAAGAAKPGLPKLAIVTEVNLAGNCSATQSCYVRVLESDNGKFPDSCGTTDDWGEMKPRYWYKNGALPANAKTAYGTLKSSGDCADTKLLRCEMQPWDSLKLYRPAESCSAENPDACY